MFKNVQYIIKYIWYLGLTIFSGVGNLVYLLSDWLRKNGYVTNSQGIMAVCWIWAIYDVYTGWDSLDWFQIACIIVIAPMLITIMSGLASLAITTVARILAFVLGPINMLYDHVSYELKNIAYDIKINNIYLFDFGLWKRKAKHQGKAFKNSETNFNFFFEAYRKHLINKAQFKSQQQYEYKKQQVHDKPLTSIEKALKLFGLSENYSKKDLRKKYLHLSKQWHPDNHPDNFEMAEQKMKEITEAYALLNL